VTVFKEKKMTRHKLSLLTVSLFAFIFLTSVSYAGPGCCGKAADQAEDENAKRAKEAPQFTLTAHDGNEVSLSDLDGKIVVLEWFNYDCPFVKAHYDSASTMIDLANKYADKDVVWLAINSTNYATGNDNKAFADAHSLPYLILDDHTGTVGRAYGAEHTPEIFIIDKTGVIAYHGAIDNAPLGRLNEGETEKINYADKALSEMTTGKEVITPKTKPYGCTVKYAK
jgi:peroxiredoxin